MKTRSETRSRVLIIEDEPDVAAYLEILLTENGFHALSETDALRAIAAADTFQPDVICLDVVMPKKTGLTIYVAIKQHPRLRHVPVVIVSALHPQRDFSDINIEKLARERNIPVPDAWLEKPIERAHFLDVIRAAASKA